MPDLINKDHADRVDRMTPAAKDARLGEAINALIVNHNALLAKLDADVGVTDTDYAATLTVQPLGTKQA